MSVTYLSISLTNILDSRSNVCCIDYTTSSIVKVNDNRNTNSSKISSSLTRGRRFPLYGILYIEKYCYDNLGIIGILCASYINFVLL